MTGTLTNDGSIIATGRNTTGDEIKIFGIYETGGGGALSGTLNNNGTINTSVTSHDFSDAWFLSEAAGISVGNDQGEDEVRLRAHSVFQAPRTTQSLG